MTNYKKLDAWVFSMDMVKEIYLITKTYPKEEMFGLTSQTKRAAVSIPCNIAEGMGRNFKRDCIQFLHVARGSAYEVETLLSIATMTEIINSEIYSKISQMLEKAIRLINSLISYLENKAGLK